MCQWINHELLLLYFLFICFCNCSSLTRLKLSFNVAQCCWQPKLRHWLATSRLCLILRLLNCCSMSQACFRARCYHSHPCCRTIRERSSTRNILTQANHGDLDWSYTSRCIRRWSPNSLLTHLYSHAFSVPPRDYKPSFPFVNINLVSQDGDDPEMVSLPQSYRLPLLMVAKYLWETLLLALSAGREEWRAQAEYLPYFPTL
jgi:hypothetical protein